MFDSALQQFNDFKDGAENCFQMNGKIAQCCLCKKNAQVWMHWNGQKNRYFYTFCNDHKSTLWEALNHLQQETVTIMPIPEEIRGEDTDD